MASPPSSSSPSSSSSSSASSEPVAVSVSMSQSPMPKRARATRSSNKADRSMDDASGEEHRTRDLSDANESTAHPLPLEREASTRDAIEKEPSRGLKAEGAESAKQIAVADSAVSGQNVQVIPTHGEWHSLSVPARFLHASCSDGKRIYLFGGVLNCPANHLGGYNPRTTGTDVVHQSLLNIYAYTPAQNEGLGNWRELKSHSQSRPGYRKFHQMVYYNERIYVFGGTNQDNRVSSKVYAFHISQQSWEICPVTEGVAPKCISHVAAIANGHIFVFGGYRNIDTQTLTNSEVPDSNALDSYNIASGKWSAVTQSGDIPHPCVCSSMVSVQDKLYLYGGYGMEGRGKVILKNLYEFNPVTSTWRELFPTGTKPGPRCGHKCAVGPEGFYITGGESKATDGTAERDIYFYHIRKNEWIRISCVNERPSCILDKFFTLEHINGVIYLIGGQNEGMLCDSKDTMTMNFFSLQNMSQLRTTEGFSRDLEAMINDKEYSDLVLLVGERELWCHRAILSCRSTYFRDRIRQIRGEGFPHRLVIDEESFASVHNFVRFIYSGIIPFMSEVDDIASLLGLAIKFNEPVMASQCEELLIRNINVDTAVGLLIVSKRLSRQALKSTALQYITSQYAAISTTSEFRLLVREPDLLLEVCTSIGSHLDANESKKRRKSAS